MSQAPTHQTIVIQQQQAQSTLGTLGLVLSCLGWLTCGLLCIPGAAASFLGLFSNKLKTHAIVGLVVGFPGVIFFILVGFAFIAPFIGLGAVAVTQAAKAQADLAAQQSQAQSPPPELAAEAPSVEEPAESMPITDNTLTTTESTITAAEPAPAPVPDPVVVPEPTMPEPAPAAEPPSRFREFTSSSGKFKVVAELVAVKSGWVKLRREDGKELTIEIVKLSEADQEWVNANPK